MCDVILGFDIFMDGFMKEVKAKVGNVDARRKINGMVWAVVVVVVACLCAESEEELERVVDEFYSECMRRKLKVNAGESKVTVFEREAEVMDYSTSSSSSTDGTQRCTQGLAEVQAAGDGAKNGTGTGTCAAGQETSHDLPLQRTCVCVCVYQVAVCRASTTLVWSCFLCMCVCVYVMH